MVPGSIFPKRDRYYWCVRFPGEDKPKTIALKPIGSKFATKDPKVAGEVAEMLWTQAVRGSKSGSSSTDRICDITAKYIEYAKDYYCDNEAVNITWALGYLNQWYGTLRPDEFGPLKLKELRKKLVDKRKSKNDDHKSLCRTSVNKIVSIICRCFEWAVSEELTYPAVYQGLATVKGIKKGRDKKVRETEEVTSVDIDHVVVVLPFTTQVVSDMIQVQLLTGMRSGELVIMRPGDIVQDDKVWLYYPYKFKGDFREDAYRSVAIGPKTQRILTKYLFRDNNLYCFTPYESETQRLGKPCTRKLNPRYDTKSYYHTVKKAINRAKKHFDLDDWNPHRLRHTAGTLIRAECDIESARAFLGHKKIKTTELYAEADKRIAISAALKHG